MASLFSVKVHTYWGHCQLKLIQIKFNQINAIKCRFLRRKENRSTQEENLSEQLEKRRNKQTKWEKVGYYLGVIY